MQGEVDEQQPNGVMSEFGYYPVEVILKLSNFLCLLYPASLRKLNGLTMLKMLLKAGYTQETKRCIA